jgi:hypothetical protein
MSSLFKLSGHPRGLILLLRRTAGGHGIGLLESIRRGAKPCWTDLSCVTTFSVKFIRSGPSSMRRQIENIYL